MQIKKFENQISKIKSKLATLGEMRPGSLNEQLTVCGKEGCRCVDPDNPKKHGPYYQLSYVHKGKSTSQFIPKSMVATVRRQLNEYKKFKSLTTEWVEVALAIARENLDQAKKAAKNMKSEVNNTVPKTGKRYRIKSD